jgi:orotate phosphoribosyltransferase
VTDEELAAALYAHAFLEGDFLLRSGRRSSYYVDKYRFSTQPDVLAVLGERLAALGRRLAPAALRIAAPELGAVALAAAASLASELPFVIVRKAVKGYGTGQLLEGAFEPGEPTYLVEDIVTSGGGAVAAVEALRSAGLECDAAVCVVDREEGGADALARAGVALTPLFRVSDLLEAGKTAAKPHG